uniref:ribosomal protein L35 n=1 Tax=Meringosphaera mediterranea TaxID=2837474 RepID=UPI00286B9D5E|nr:ribosomal protein L35 [Meringosphaera mediterranea]WLD05786.1 ribosomal protein L35 [Meringosphaera mediterranea]WLD05804.1 ribosomal protein L35 [Meringosphaera mediterranea]WLD06024.1 ribosomal protein L35 [Meringosphaera mediterranea]
MLFYEIIMKNKLKTRSSAAKRYQKTKNGKVLRRKAYRGHILEKKSQKRKRNLRQKGLVFSGDAKQIELMLPY